MRSGGQWDVRSGTRPTQNKFTKKKKNHSFYRFIDFIPLCFCRETKESLERTLSQLAEVQGALERQRQEAEADTRRDREQEVKLMIDSVAAAELDNLR